VELTFFREKSGLPQSKKWSGKSKIPESQGKVREFYFELGKTLIFCRKGSKNFNNLTRLI